MSWHHVSDKTCAARKRHTCELCGQKIQPGWRYLNRFGYGEDGPVNFHMHIECEKLTRDWDEMDWETHSIGDGDWPSYDDNGKVIPDNADIWICPTCQRVTESANSDCDDCLAERLRDQP